MVAFVLDVGRRRIVFLFRNVAARIVLSDERVLGCAPDRLDFRVADHAALPGITAP